MLTVYIYKTYVSMYVVETETPVLSSQLYVSGGLVRCLSAYDNLTRVLYSVDVDLCGRPRRACFSGIPSFR